MTQRPFSLALVAALLVSGCEKSVEAPPEPGTSSAAAEAAPASPNPPPAAKPASPAASPNLEAPVLVPEADKGEKGARNVLLEWARAIERGDWARAAAQYGAGSDFGAADLRKQFAPLGRVSVGFGDGEVEGAAGSLYYSVPVTAKGNGRSLSGEAVLRRVNDVDGASPEQLRWHIERTDLKP